VASSYLNSFIALLCVGMTLTFSFAMFITPIRSQSEVYRLHETLNLLAGTIDEAVTSVVEHNSTFSTVLRLPSRIGDREYWLRLDTDTTQTWVEGAFGQMTSNSNEVYRVYLPQTLAASGSFEGKYQLVVITCQLNNAIPIITLQRSE
jgi:hypothetical protein